ncbi:YgaP-like transmembrane domain [Hyalangium sp.]|uniref:YgaP-like transmembrane domain n=1 Tax=Hyalangium sp. TaxID=2028555 RepID=UPI002D2EEC1D|nr:YgaP-like transmembrane domain [Hyalangium sp.]HYI00061.1 YgaP-like transmembrane domain [Hyalangium sp.]
MLAGFMASRTGRWLRILAGAGMVLGGLAAGSSRGAVVAVAGLGPLMAGALDLCLLGPLFGHPIRGADIRRNLGQPAELSLFRTRYERLSPHARMLLH